MPDNEVLSIDIRSKENVSSKAKKAEDALKDLLKAADDARTALKSVGSADFKSVEQSASKATNSVTKMTQAMKEQKKANMAALEAYKQQAKESARAEREQTAERIRQMDKEYEVERNLKKNVEAHVASITSQKSSTMEALTNAKAMVESARNKALPTTSSFAGRGAYDTAQTKELIDRESALKKTTQATKELDKAQKSASSSSQKMSSSNKGLLGTLSNLFSSLKRIAKLRILRGIIRGISSAISEGTGNLYQYSAAMGSADSANFSGNMDALASTLAQLKNAIGSVAGQLLANLMPALSTVASWFIMAANAAAQFLAALGGRATYSRAKTQTTAWKETAGAVGGATAAAKEYKNTLMGFDEINALDDPSNGGGGGGGGGASAPDFSDMFEEVPLERTGIIGALNRLGELLHPVLEDLGREVADFIDGTVSLVDGGINIIDGLLNNDKEKIKKGVEEVQDAFKKNEVFKVIGDRVFNLERAILNTIHNIRKVALNALANLLDGMSFINPAFGEAADQVRAWNEQLDHTQDLQDKITTLMQKMTYGEISYSGFESAVRLLNKQLPNLEYNTQRVVDKISALRSQGNLSRDALIRLANTNPTFSALLEATGNVDQALQDIVDGSIEVKDGVLKIGEIDIPVRTIDELNKVENAEYNTARQAEETRRKLENIGTANFKPYKLASDFRTIQTGAENATGAIDGTRGSVNMFDRLNPSFQLVRNAYGGVATEVGKTNSTVYGTQTAINTVNGMNPGFYGISTGLANGAWYAQDFSNKMWNLKGAIDTVNGSSVHIYAGTQFGGGSGKFAKGGYVQAFANGGMIPAYADGSIRTADIFAANENGIPELIGRIGNRTAVANQGQMVDVLADGVFRALAPLFSGGQANTEVNVYMDNEVVARAAERGKQSLNRRFNVSLA